MQAVDHAYRASIGIIRGVLKRGYCVPLGGTYQGLRLTRRISSWKTTVWSEQAEDLGRVVRVRKCMRMMTLIPKRLLWRRWFALALSRIAPVVAPRRTTRVVIGDSDGIGSAVPSSAKWPEDALLRLVGTVRNVDAHPCGTKCPRFLSVFWANDETAGHAAMLLR
jgi:hypothetical protein